MEQSKYALVFSDDCRRNENVLEYVKKQVQKHHLNCEMRSSKDSSSPLSSSCRMLITAPFDWLAKEVYSETVNILFIRHIPQMSLLCKCIKTELEVELTNR